jgi:catalase
MLVNVAKELAQGVADDLGMKLPPALPLAMKKSSKPEVVSSAKLSLFARPGDGTIRGRKVAILVANGINAAFIQSAQNELGRLGAVARLVGVRLGSVKSEEGETVEVDATLETTPAVLYDGLIVPGGREAAQALGKVGHVAEFIKDQYRHCKTMGAIGAGGDLLENAGVAARLPTGESDPGVLVFADNHASDALQSFVNALAQHRHFARSMDPPPV